MNISVLLCYRAALGWSTRAPMRRRGRGTIRWYSLVRPNSEFLAQYDLSQPNRGVEHHVALPRAGPEYATSAWARFALRTCKSSWNLVRFMWNPTAESRNRLYGDLYILVLPVPALLSDVSSSTAAAGPGLGRRQVGVRPSRPVAGLAAGGRRRPAILAIVTY